LKISNKAVPVKISKSFLEGAENMSDFKSLIEKSLKGPTTELLEVILGGAVSLRASDLHFEPQEESVRIRVRIDGMLHDVMDIGKDLYKNIVSRIKLLSKAKLNVVDRPQAGRFTIEKEKSEIEIRTSLLPSEEGESVVLRILDPEKLVEMEDLGLREDLLSFFEKEIKKPNGMVIITGPTGSGKTTTLYAFLKKIQRPGIKIITIEDPIEYHLEDITQTQTNPSKGYDFASGLKSIMRQDPDVILVGEIRDGETAKIAVQAALTGHLVFSTLHTNDAAGTIARMASLGAETTNLGPAINVVVAQRLVRKICEKCSVMEKPTPEEMEKIKKSVSSIAEKADLPPLDFSLKIPKAKGCKYCNNTGYKGRVGIFESFPMDDEMEKFILKNPSIASLREKAIEKGMVTMGQDGIIKVLKKMTTIEEVERVSET
jgi:type II secretory ATPase GspE/PulE/Tfp pilus assembly ATPase PilB-like protein